MTDKKSTDSRRKLLKSIAAGSGAVVLGKSLPESWSKPVVDSVLLPAHALTTEGGITAYIGQNIMVDIREVALVTGTRETRAIVRFNVSNGRYHYRAQVPLSGSAAPAVLWQTCYEPPEFGPELVELVGYVKNAPTVTVRVHESGAPKNSWEKTVPAGPTFFYTLSCNGVPPRI